MFLILVRFVPAKSDLDWTSPLPDVLLLVLLGDQHIGAVGLEVVGGDLPQDFHVHGEVHLQAAVLDVIVPVGHIRPAESEELVKCTGEPHTAGTLVTLSGGGLKAAAT